MAPVIYGYARVSSRDQNLSRQLDALADFGISAKNVYSDKASGKDFDRPAYKRLMAKLRRGDTLVIKSIDRLGRGYDEILAEWHRISKGRGAFIVVFDMPLLDTRERPGDITGALIADIVLQLLSYVAIGRACRGRAWIVRAVEEFSVLPLSTRPPTHLRPFALQ